MKKFAYLKTFMMGILCLLGLSFAICFGGFNALYVNATNESGQSYNIGQKYHGYDLNNLEPFISHLEDLGYELTGIPSISEDEYLQEYWEAMSIGIIIPVDNDILLAGVPKIQPFWGASGAAFDKYNESTHQFLADKAYEYVAAQFLDLYSAIPSSKLKGSSNGAGTDWANVVWYSNWPDDKETDAWLFIPTQTRHFYYPENGGNLYIKGGEFQGLNSSINAKSSFIGHYNDAIAFWKSGNRIEAFRSLGKSLHYVTDLATPVHTGYQVNDFTGALGWLGFHGDFEDDAAVKQNNFTYDIDPANWDIGIDIFAHNLAVTSNGLFSSTLSTMQSRAEVALKNSANACASVLVRFAHEARFNTTNVGSNEIRIDGTNNWAIQGAYTIPSILKGRTVTAIGNNAFANCTSLTAMSIPASVTTIGNSAFMGCTSLTAITIPSGVTAIDSSTFANCTSLTNINIPSSVTTIGNTAFAGCASLTAISIPSGVTTIGNNAFANCTSLTAISIPAGVSSIGTGVFSGCNALGSITVASGNTVYRSEGNCIIRRSDNALIMGCNNSIIPNGITSIGDYAFSGCTGFTATIPSSVISIGDYAFYWCFNITTITIPSSVTSIGEFAFYGSGLTSIIFEANSQLTNIGGYAFDSELASILILDSVETIGIYAFGGWDMYTVYAGAESMPDGWQFNLWSYTERPVIWGCVFSADSIGYYVASFTKTADSITNPDCYDLYAPYRKGYTFGGWTTVQGGAAVYDMTTIDSAPNGTTLYAVWIPV